MKREHKPKEYWMQMVAEFEGSGLTQQVFAEQRQVKLSTFRRWLYLSRRSETPKVQFVEVTSKSLTFSSPSLLKIHLDAGFVLEFETLPPPAYLAELSACFRAS